VTPFITEGDVYAPRRGELALTVPLFARYLLTHYEHARSHATTSLATPERIRRNLPATHSAPSPDASPAGRRPHRAAVPTAPEHLEPRAWPLDRPSMARGLNSIAVGVLGVD
jgi:hypothetical protein